MKNKWTIIANVLLLVLTIGCNNTHLHVINNSGYDLEFISWTHNDGEVYHFGDLPNKSGVKQDVDSGSGFIRFKIPGNITNYRTFDEINVAAVPLFGPETDSFKFEHNTKVVVDN